jgi:uncharacterized protein YbjQ (UPF0145 family)
MTIIIRERIHMMIVTTENIANHQITDVLGPVFGLTVRARGIGKDIVASFKGLVGGEINQYTEMLEDARKQAMDRMVKNATAMGANAIIMMRFDSGEIGQNMSEIVAYGTAVIVEKR